jgi:hypothetical protein
MARTTVKVEGFKELDRALADMKRSTGSGMLKRAGLKAMQPMADLAARLAPNDPKTPPLDLATSITVAAGRKTFGDRRASIYMGPAVSLPRFARAIVMEFGSFKDAPQPYMRPAYDQDAAGVVERLKPLIKAEIDKTVARLAARAARSAAKG